MNRPRIVVVVDVGSASVGAGLVLIRPNHPPHILYQTRHDIVFQEHLNFERFLRSTERALEAAVLDIVRNGLPHITLGRKRIRDIDRVLVSYASPWYIAQTKELSMGEGKPFTFTKAMVDDATAKEEHAALARMQEEYKDVAPGQMVVIEKNVTNIKINGYRVEEPYDKEAQQVSFTLSLSLMVEPLRIMVTNTIERHVRSKEVSHHSFAYIGFVTVRTLFPDDHSFLFLDVSGEVSDIACVRDGALAEMVSFPFGMRHIVRVLMKQLDISMHEVETLVGLHAAGAVGKDTRVTFEQALTDAQKKWQAMFAEAITHLSSRSVPQRVFLTADVPFIPILASTLANDTWSVVVLGPEQLAHHVSSREKRITDAFIALASLFIHTVDE